MTCDNKSNVHDPITISEDMNALRVGCKNCKIQEVIRKEPNTGAPEKRQYAKFFKRDTLQGNTNLFYKVHPQYLQI